jgi:hypothetical protein
VSEAPACCAAASLSALMSTETMRRWPIAFSTAIACSPSPPAPTTTMGSSAGRGITLLIAEKTVMPEQA